MCSGELKYGVWLRAEFHILQNEMNQRSEARTFRAGAFTLDAFDPYAIGIARGRFESFCGDEYVYTCHMSAIDGLLMVQFPRLVLHPAWIGQWSIAQDSFLSQP